MIWKKFERNILAEIRQSFHVFPQFCLTWIIKFRVHLNANELSHTFINVNVNYYNSKGDFDKAIGQYIKTIGYLEPSYIIRKVILHANIQN